ncbi:GDSL-type esterase/lipase family protein [Tardiphaga sp.]|uniref:GDSL-type esterase/lipase family protein n=1 Tax=Tardiphaga sp. TaxID=1926292 RepID=UPI00260B7308|nr:GDSL-type esterase/lipase family protein [Tardiphaga sp.]
MLPAAAQAASVHIVALGASNTYGHGRGRTNGGVEPSQAFPAQLEAMLRARGLDAHVANAGIPGDTTGGMLQRLGSAVPNGTQIVILQPGGNDARRGEGASRSGNIAAIQQQLAARHIRVIMTGMDAPASTRDPDGQHFNAQGHTAVAASLVPKVMAAMRGR